MLYFVFTIRRQLQALIFVTLENNEKYSMAKKRRPFEFWKVWIGIVDEISYIASEM